MTTTSRRSSSNIIITKMLSTNLSIHLHHIHTGGAQLVICVATADGSVAAKFKSEPVLSAFFLK